MHIPDGFLDAKTWVGAGALSSGIIAWAIRRTKCLSAENHIPRMGVMAAFIFAAQAVDFPFAGGTSGHFMGGALAAIVLGPWSAVLVMTTVLVVQCLIFQDGGITALGANILSMAITGPLAGYGVYRALARVTRSEAGIGKLSLVNAGLAAWVSLVSTSLVCAGELALSGKIAPGVVLPAMAAVHGLIGIVEGVITALVLSFVHKVRPDLFLPLAGD